MIPSFTYIHDDYAQSANVLFHFMKKPDFLTFSLKNKALIPRYCIEDISYLNIVVDDYPYNKIAVLEKCFCDIPFHQLTASFYLQGIGESFNQLPIAEQEGAQQNNTHPDFYGKYALAFSKEWGESKHLQPIHYINPKSISPKVSATLSQIISDTNLPDSYSNLFLYYLSYSKPLRGRMERVFKDSIHIEFLKNFHDEKEWRFVPSEDIANEYGFSSVVANSNMVDNPFELESQNALLESSTFNKIRIEYSYSDIKYIIVPDSDARIQLIDFILRLDDHCFTSDNIQLQRNLLISKILVLDEIRKDW